jgi:hypothetical protein
MAAAGAAAAAAAKRAAEEEHMTNYSREDLTEDWEFKIVRANTGVFSKPAVFQKLIEEEARAGWQFVEKFDNSRVRFKRPASARRRDAQLPEDVDPYRTQYGLSEGAFVVVLLGIIFGILGLVVLLAVLLEGRG